MSGWHQVFVDDFTKNVPLGSSCTDTAGFPGAVSSTWGAYPYPWTGTPTWGIYCPARTTSLHDGEMDIWLHTELVNGVQTHLIDAVLPKFGSGGSLFGSGQTYGRYVVRYKSDTFKMFHASWLLWPNSNVWPADGEIDFPEGDFSGSTNAYMHWMNGTSGGSQDAYSTSVAMGGSTWHTAVIEWLPTRCTFILDGNVIGNSTSTSKIPSDPMHFIIQNGGSFSQTPDNTSQGHIYIDWVAVYAPGP